MSRRDVSDVPGRIASGTFAVDRVIGAGCYGEVWHGVNSQTKEEVAVKFEAVDNDASSFLAREIQLLSRLSNPMLPQGFAEVFCSGIEDGYKFAIMACLGENLEDRLQMCDGRFTVKSVVLAAAQVLSRIEYIHSKGIIHRDIKPANFPCGINAKVHHIYMVEFGLSKLYYEKHHVKLRRNAPNRGTPRYASLNSQRGLEQSRQDDLEATGYMFLYFLRGSLPWSGLQAACRREHLQKILQKKESVKLSDLCTGFPEAFQAYLAYCRNLGFEERPDYTALRGLFRNERVKLGKDSLGQPIGDHEFEWLQGVDPSNLCPLQATEGMPQPDDGTIIKRPYDYCTCLVKRDRTIPY